MKQARILSVGKLKTPHWQAAAEHYRKRLKGRLRLEEATVRDADPACTPEQRAVQEGERLLKLVKPQETLICLDQGGRQLASPDFAAFLQNLWDKGHKPCFVIGGAYGLSRQTLGAATHSISFGAMTFTHELAFVLLLEQLYRAESILSGSGYHH